ncbi:MAG TPA: POTRA domain-containing protein [Bryobacteraceae bacterium]|nr:POTRA domain-containing protein [Bryobacteraceae bacterium]
MLWLAALALVALQDPFPITTLRVQGNSRFPAEAIARASGLAVDRIATPKDFETACTRLVETGLIASARYEYKPSATNGYEVVLTVAEADDLYDIRIDIPGVDPARVWTWLAQNEPLVQPRGPTSNAALAFYQRAIERFLAEQGAPKQVTARLRTDPETGAVVAVFRPATLDRVTGVKFEGNSIIGARALEKAIEPALDMEYTGADFREMLDFNVRPLYEEQGRYALNYTRVEMTAGVVTVALEEGRAFQLGGIDVAGEKLPIAPEVLAKLVRVPEGEPPNWKKIAQGAVAVEAALGRLGYLDANVQLDRRIDDQAGRIDIVLSVEKGQQYAFGSLRLDGLDPQSEARARSLWKLTPGSVMRLDYLDQYERLLMRDDAIRFKRISRRHMARAGTGGVADVTFTFRP